MGLNPTQGGEDCYDCEEGFTMAIVAWNENMATGFTEIDNQHKKLIDITNTLADAMKARRSNEELGMVLSELQQYTVKHFSNEEAYMRQYAYPNFAAHQLKHKEFIAKVDGFSKDFKSGKLMISLEIMNFLSDWLVKHIKGTDMEYVPHLKAAGMK